MDIDTFNAIKALFEEYVNKDSSTVTAAYITILGMLGVSILGFISQWFITKHIVSEERNRLLIQLNSEEKTKQHEKWESNIFEAIHGLLKATDPEINSEINPAIVTSNVLKIQLLLGEENSHKKVNRLVNELALTANGCRPDASTTELLSIHDELLEAAKLLIYRPSIL